MNKITPTKRILVSLAAALGLALSASGQEAPTTSTNYGLLGQEYTGLNFGYVHHVSGPPRVLHHYGFISNRPTSPNWDVAFKYDYITGSAWGVRTRSHEAAVNVTRYVSLEAIKPFIHGDIGWALQKIGSAKDDSYTYRLGVGAEWQLLPQLALTPSINYEDAPKFHARGWNYAAKATYRAFKEWSVSLATILDEDHNVEWQVGVNRHF
jgi:hypothetical protein